MHFETKHRQRSFVGTARLFENSMCNCLGDTNLTFRVMDAKKRKCVWSLDHGPLKVVISINTGWVYKREEEH